MMAVNSSVLRPVNQGQRRSVAEVRRSGVRAEAAGGGALVAGGQGGHALPGLPGPVHLVAAPTSLPVSKNKFIENL